VAENSTLLVTALGDEPLAPLVLAREMRACRVICVGRPAVGWRVEPLLRALRRHGYAASWLPLVAADVPSAIAEVDAVVSIPPGEAVAFDLTNAHGVVGFALYEVARRYETADPPRCRVVRIDWSDRLVRSVSPDVADARPVSVRLLLAEFLELHGKWLLGVERARGGTGRYGLAARRVARALPAARPLLEAVHQGAWDRPLRFRRRQGSDALAADLVADGVLVRTGSAIRAADLRAFQFLHGRWLEEYLFEVADASGRFDDCASGVRFSWSVDGVEHADVANEIDFAGTAGGRATIASCKTGFRDANAVLYELLTLAERAAGRSVVSVFATSESLDKAARQRAAALGVKTLDAEMLADPDRVLSVLLGDAQMVRSARPR
jgi:hypothetical protein